MSDLIIQGVDLHKVYHGGSGEVVALAGIDITVAPGELIAVMGPSGCGKSSLLHVLSGIDPPSSGRVLVEGTNLATLDGDRRAALRRDRMGMLFQSHALLPALTLGENVALPLALNGVGRTERTTRAAALLDIVGLGDRVSDLPDSLSGGQRGRVALARALVNDPHVVFADEPTGSLDNATARTVLDAMMRLLRAHGTALVMVTHDPAAAMRADRVIRLRDGRLAPATQQAMQPAYQAQAMNANEVRL